MLLKCIHVVLGRATFLRLYILQLITLNCQLFVFVAVYTSCTGCRFVGSLCSRLFSDRDISVLLKRHVTPLAGLQAHKSNKKRLHCRALRVKYLFVTSGPVVS